MAASEDEGPQALSRISLGVECFQVPFFHRSARDYLWFPSGRAWSVIHGWGFSQLLQKMDDFPQSQVFGIGKIKTQNSSNLFSFSFLFKQAACTYSVPTQESEPSKSIQRIFVKRASRV